MSLRVICIDDNMEPYDKNKNTPQPYFGDIDIVIGEGVWPEFQEEYYRLERFGINIGYSKKHFAPLSDTNEKDIRRNNAVEKWLKTLV